MIHQQNKKLQKGIFITILSCSGLFFSVFFVQATESPSVTEMTAEQEKNLADKQDQVDAINAKIKAYKQIISLKQREGSTLADQITSLQAQADKLELEISINKEKITNLEGDISSLTSRIAEKEILFNHQKQMLSELMRIYYGDYSDGKAALIFSSAETLSFLNQENGTIEIGDKVSELLGSVKALKESLIVERVSLEEKKKEADGLHVKLTEQSDYLDSTKTNKARLLATTQADEKKYQTLISHLEEQKKELLDIDQYFTASGLSADSYPKPDSKYFASTSWYFSQRDPAWGNETIGNTKTLMKSYGCAVTAVAMVFKEHGGSMNPGKLANQSIFSGDLINWPNSWSNPKLTLNANGKSHGNINWSTVDTQIAKGNPVIVYIKKSNGGGGHYVVVHHKDSKGRYVVHDPYFGANIFLDTSRALVGAMGNDSKTSIDQMIIYQ